MNVDELKAENERLKKDLDLAANIAKTFIEKNSDLEKELEATHDRYVVKIEVRIAKINSGHATGRL